MASPVKLIVAGLFDSGPGHWQSLWCDADPDCRKVELGEWAQPSRVLWLSRLDRAVAREREPVVLVAHSLGCLAVAWWAAEASRDRLAKVRAALLVAPPDVDRPDTHPLLRPFAPSPSGALPFPAMLVASRDDRYACFESAAALAARWNCTLIDAGARGHLNAESDIGDWPEGRALVDQLVDVNNARPIAAGSASSRAVWADHAAEIKRSASPREP
ncbi:MAG: alpha/beta hydrolase [Sphingomonadaceae bacterium]|nr:alpha/beta hydrolase [Sphingomonadaceae bacterium]